MQLIAELEGVCHRCGASRMVLEVARRRCVLPTCNCREETLRNTINAVLDVLERHLTEPMYEQARVELREFIAEFGDEDA